MAQTFCGIHQCHQGSTPDATKEVPQMPPRKYPRCHQGSTPDATKEVPQIVIPDGHHSYKMLTAVTYAKEHGIHMVTLSPYCTHRMQPLDRTFFKSLKTNYNVASGSWMVSNPGKRITFYDVADIFGKAFSRSAKHDKAVTGFRVCGLWPFDANIFTDDDFVASHVTDEAAPDSDQSAGVGPLPTLASRAPGESLPLNTDGPSVTTQTIEISATTLAVKTSESANIASAPVQTIDQTVCPPIYQSPGPSTIANIVTTHAGPATAHLMKQLACATPCLLCRQSRHCHGRGLARERRSQQQL